MSDIIPIDDAVRCPACGHVGSRIDFVGQLHGTRECPECGAAWDFVDPPSEMTEAELRQAFGEYERGMEEAVPQIVADVARRQALAVEARQRVLIPCPFGDPRTMAVRAKVRCDGKAGNEVCFSTVYEPDEARDAENARFTKATPWGNIRMGIDNPVAMEQFEPGKTYFVDFTPAE